MTDRFAHWYPKLLLGIAALGFLDATYLAVEHYTTFSLPCSITHGCEFVTNSVYSEILGIPVAVLGAAYYASVLLGTVVAQELKKPRWLLGIAYSTTLGFLFSLWFVYAQLFLIKAICQYCMVSAATSTMLFVVSMLYLRTQRIKTSFPSPSPVATPEE